MRKTTIAIDDELVAKASAILGTKGIKETVNRALHEVLVQDARLHEIERLANQYRHLPPEELNNRSWR